MTDKETISKESRCVFEERKKDYTPFDNFRDMHWVLTRNAKIVVNIENGKLYYIVGLSEVGGCHFDLREYWDEENGETGKYNRKISDEVVTVGAEELFEKYFFEGLWPVGMCKR